METTMNLVALVTQFLYGRGYSIWTVASAESDKTDRGELLGVFKGHLLLDAFFNLSQLLG